MFAVCFLSNTSNHRKRNKILGKSILNDLLWAIHPLFQALLDLKWQGRLQHIRQW